MRVDGPLTKVIRSPVLLAVAWIVAVPLVLLRFFGFPFFAGTTSWWAIVPALVLAALLGVASRMPGWRRMAGILLMAAYGCSVVAHGWADMQLRRNEGQGNLLDVLEAALILLLVARCFTARADAAPGPA